MLLVTNRYRVSKNLSFVDLSYKSPDSGLGQTTRKVIYQASFSPRLPNKREKGPPDRSLRLA